MNCDKYFEKIKTMKFTAQKELGQNYLISPEICEKIVDSLNLQSDDNCIEIGCGLGSLSYFLNEKENKTTIIDIDQNSLNYLNENLKPNSNIEVVNMNALKMDYSNYNKIIGNLPYYITTSILEKVLLTAKTGTKCIFMVQKEAFERINSKINTETYSPLTVLMNYVCDARQLFLVSKVNFTPIPHVDSLVFELNFKDFDESFRLKLYKTTKSLFLLRRKTISNNLKSTISSSDERKLLLEKANIKENARPQELSLNDYINIAKLM